MSTGDMTIDVLSSRELREKVLLEGSKVKMASGM